MSGGSYDYVCFKIGDISLSNTSTDPRRAAFQKLLKLVATAMHDIEWVDSCDSGPGDEHAAIDAVFSFLGSDPATVTKARAYDELATIVRRYLAFSDEVKP